MHNIGDRVGAICGTKKDGTLKVYGYGVYEGEKVPEVPEDSRGMAIAFQLGEVTNPCILLDSGERVYGCECWWGTEEAIAKRVKNHPHGNETVSPVEDRKPVEEEDVEKV